MLRYVLAGSALGLLAFPAAHALCWWMVTVGTWVERVSG